MVAMVYQSVMIPKQYKDVPEQVKYITDTKQWVQKVIWKNWILEKAKRLDDCNDTKRHMQCLVKRFKHLADTALLIHKQMDFYVREGKYQFNCVRSSSKLDWKQSFRFKSFLNMP